MADDVVYMEDLLGEVLQATDRQVTIVGAPDSVVAPWMCWHCGRKESKSVALRKCTRCNRAYYCSKECQAAQWYAPLGHKPFCKSVSSQNDLSEADGYHRFQQKREGKKVYVLECEQCSKKMFCSNADIGCPKALAWQAICTESTLVLVAMVHSFYVNKAANEKEQMIALEQLQQSYDNKKAASCCEDDWLLKTFLHVCTFAARGNPLPYIQDLDYPNGRPIENLSLSSLHPYFGRDDLEDVRTDIPYTAHCILHTASRQLVKDYHPNHRPKRLMRLVRFLDRVFYKSGIQLNDTEPPTQFVMQPEDVFLVYLAKKRARVLLRA